MRYKNDTKVRINNPFSEYYNLEGTVYHSFTLGKSLFYCIKFIKPYRGVDSASASFISAHVDFISSSARKQKLNLP